MSNNIERDYAYANKDLELYESRLPNFKQGWVNPIEIRFLDILENIPINNHGDIIEIGVYYGQFAIALNMTAKKNEEIVLVDIWNKQYKNVSQSGVISENLGDMQEFMKNQFEKYDTVNMGRNIRCIESDSLDLRPKDVGARKYKYFSIDGGHHKEHVMNDLKLAENGITKEGIVILDDFYSRYFLGVTEGLFNYKSSGGSLVPVALCGGKLYLCNYSAYPVWKKHLTNLGVRCKIDTLLGYEVVHILGEKFGAINDTC
jgi:hypothetical protein